MKKSLWNAAPFSLWMLLFTLAPLGLVVYYAFTDANGAYTWHNILALGTHLSTFWYSIVIGMISTLICLVLAYPLAYGISRGSERVQQTMIMLVMLPMWMNFLLRTYAWQPLLEPNGLFNRLFGLVGLGPFQMLNTHGAVVMGMVYNYLPFMILPLYSVMVKIDSRTIEAAQDLGGGFFQVIRRVVLPLSLPGIVSGITMVFVPAVSTFALTKLLGGDKKAMIGDVIESMFNGQTLNHHVGSALSLVLMILILLCMAVVGMVDKDEDTGGFMG